MSEIESAEEFAKLVRVLTLHREAVELIRERDAAVRAQALRDAAELPSQYVVQGTIGGISAQASACNFVARAIERDIRAMIEEPHS